MGAGGATGVMSFAKGLPLPHAVVVAGSAKANKFNHLIKNVAHAVSLLDLAQSVFVLVLCVAHLNGLKCSQWKNHQKINRINPEYKCMMAIMMIFNFCYVFNQIYKKYQIIIKTEGFMQIFFTSHLFENPILLNIILLLTQVISKLI